MTGASYWQRDAGWRDRWRDVPPPDRADVLVIGGGFAGLMTAIRIREVAPSASIALVEAERIGFGASGRNAGFLSPLAAPVWLLGAHRDREQAWAAAKLNADVHAIARWIAEHVPSCELAPVTLALQAWSRVSDAALGEFVAALAHTGLPHELVASRARPERRVLEMAAYTLHPMRLVQGLAEVALQRGITIHEGVRVQRIDGERVLASTGELRARTSVVCTNAYTPSIELPYAPNATAVYSFMAATASVDPATLVRDTEFTVEVRGTQPYHRMHAGRVIFGGGDQLRPPDEDYAVPEHVKARLAVQIRESFGRELPIAEAWSGVFHTNVIGLPIIHPSKVNPSIILNVGYGGTGAALSLVWARLAAAMTIGTFASADDARLAAVIWETDISKRDAMRAIARIAARLAMPWRA